MSGNNITSSLSQLLLKYKQLPYITIKKSSRRYLIPHKPSRPRMIYFNIATNAIKEHSLKYNQYFSSDKLWQKVSQKFEQKKLNKQKTKQMINETEYKKNWDDYNEKMREYNVKYREPFQLMAVNSYCMFKRDYYRKIQEEKLKSNNKQSASVDENKNSRNNKSVTDDQLQVANTKNKKLTKKQQKLDPTITTSQESIIKINKLKVSQVWNKMSPQEKKVYEDQFERLRRENEARIREFIKNHEIPVVKRYSTMSRFTSRYSAIYQLNISDPALYQKYKQLPQQEKQSLSKQAKAMNKESKQRMQEFLRKWNISKQQLTYIIEVSEKYLKKKRTCIAQSRKQNHIKVREQMLLNEEQQQYELDQQDQQEDQKQDQQKIGMDKSNSSQQDDNSMINKKQ